jgi:hypothetical protein
VVVETNVGYGMDTAVDFCSAGFHRECAPVRAKGWRRNRFFDRSRRRSSGFSFARHVWLRNRGVYAPPLQAVFGTAALDASGLGLAVLAGVTPLPVITLEKWLARRWRARTAVCSREGLDPGE